MSRNKSILLRPYAMLTMWKISTAFRQCLRHLVHKVVFIRTGIVFQTLKIWWFIVRNHLLKRKFQEYRRVCLSIILRTKTRQMKMKRREMPQPHRHLMRWTMPYYCLHVEKWLMASKMTISWQSLLPFLAGTSSSSCEWCLCQLFSSFIQQHVHGYALVITA